ncbi:MAG: hypothetical protein DHS80DRAFT_29848 [Piptocephalis tieghemiana]|nr:MAG: hypothetical protein DHS80DRAFT_29848 [Piptocephalis tieghemiana]
MQFGQDLQGQLTDVSERLCNHTAFLGEVQEMVKERAQLEKEYASRLEALARKYVTIRHKRAASLVVSAGAIKSLDQSTLSNSISQSTLLQAYDAYLEEMGIMAQNRHEYAGLLVSEAGDRLHALALRKEEARKRHMQFAAKLLQDRTKNAADTKKARLKWMEACEAAETSRLKMERRTDERSYAKAVRQYETDKEDMYNYKNLYIINLRVCNDLRRKYAQEDMPALLNFQGILQTLTRLELNSLDQCKVQLQGVMEAIDEVSPRQDACLFTKMSKVPLSNESDIPFEGHLTDERQVEEDELYLQEPPNRTYLLNLMRKSKALSLELDPEIAEKEKEIREQEERTKAFLTSDGGNAIDVTMDANDLRNRRGHFVEIEQIHQALGDTPEVTHPHSFQPASFTIPTSCDYCAMTIWGISKQGYTCKGGFSSEKTNETSEWRKQASLTPPSTAPSSVSSGTRELLTPKTMAALTPNSSTIEEELPEEEGKRKSEGHEEERGIAREESSGSIGIESHGKGGDVGFEEECASSSTSAKGSTPSTPTHLPSPLTPGSKQASGSKKDNDKKESSGVYRRPSIPSIFRQNSSLKSSAVTSNATSPMITSPSISSPTGGTNHTRKSTESSIPTVSSKRSESLGLFDVAIDRPNPTLMATATVLYDYTARTDMELSVNKGGLVNVLELDDGSGWVKAELNGLEGLVPAAYLAIDEDESDDEQDKDTLNGSIDLVQAIYDYQARSEEEMSIYAGVIIEVTNRECSEGWWEGRVDGQVGRFPASYVQSYHYHVERD